tara:strand:+ start:932 stop:1519 length:588 start_codon:yes stop_codon:yes gene_type:complete
MKGIKKSGRPGAPHHITNISNYYIQRFYDKLIHTPNGCHMMQGHSNNNGYMNWYYRYEDQNGENTLRYITAHRFAAFISGLYTEDAVNEYSVLHDCDQLYAKDDITYRACCNPAHLFLGTVQDNALDCIAKGRNTQQVARNGEDNYNAKLSEVDAQYIIDNHYAITQKQLAVKCGVHVSTIEAIHGGKTWKHLSR